MIPALLIALFIGGAAATAEADQTCVAGKHQTVNGVMYVEGPMGTRWRCTEEDIARATARYNARGK